MLKAVVQKNYVRMVTSLKKVQNLSFKTLFIPFLM